MIHSGTPSCGDGLAQWWFEGCAVARVRRCAGVLVPELSLQLLHERALLGYADTYLTGENTVNIYAHHGIDLINLTQVSFDDR